MEKILHQLIWQIKISHYLQGFIHPRCCRLSSINSMNQHIEFTKKAATKNIMQVTKSLIFAFWTTHCCEAASCLAAPSGYQPLPGWWRVATAVDSQQPWPSLELIFSAAGWNAMDWCHVTRKHPGNPGGWSHTLMWRWCWRLLTSEFWCFVYQSLFIRQSMRVW